jgi:hypothetical protein
MIDEHNEHARASHTKGPRNLPRSGALNLLQKSLHFRGTYLNLCPAFLYRE